MKTLRNIFLLLLSFMAFASCGGNSGDGPDAPDPTPEPTTADYSALKDFITARADAGDYCKSFNVSSTGIMATSVSGEKISLGRNSVPYLTVNVTNPFWTVNGQLSKTETPKDIRDCAPAVGTSPEGNLTVGAADLGVKAGDGLLCVINARKHIYFCFADGVKSWGSEVYRPYNPPLRNGDNEINILFIGNSFTQDATQHLPGMLTASGIDNVHMIRLFHGGYTLPEYLANFDKNGICAMRHSHPGDKEWRDNESQDDSPAKALSERVWDIVVIQEHTGRKEGWEWPGTLKTALNGLIDRIWKAQPDHRPTIVYIMAQTYSNGSNVLKSNFNDNRATMFATTTHVAQKVIEETAADIIISTGAVLENLRTTSLNVDNGMQLTRDSYHMDYGISRYAAACAVFETLITPLTGRTTDACPWRYSVSSNKNGEYSTPVDDANAPIARRAAHEAVNAPFVVTDLSSL